MSELPIFGAPAPASTSPPVKQVKQTKNEIERTERFRRDANKPVQWHQNIRTANGGAGRFDYINIEALYNGFRQRLLDDPAFERHLTERVIDRIMAELFVPLSHTPRKGVRLSICRKPKINA